MNEPHHQVEAHGVRAYAAVRASTPATRTAHPRPPVVRQRHRFAAGLRRVVDRLDG